MEEKPNLNYIKGLSNLMDSKFSVPGTKYRFGIDPILGLIPGIGDMVSFAISGVIIFYLSKYGASRAVMFKMMGNAALDALIGSIPIIGSIFDFVYKANDRNVRLLREHYEEGKHQGSGTKYIILFIAIFVIILVVIAELVWWLVELLAGIF